MTINKEFLNDNLEKLRKELEEQVDKDMFNSMGINPQDSDPSWGIGDKYTAPSLPNYPNTYPTSPNTVGYPNTYDTFTRPDDTTERLLRELLDRMARMEDRLKIIDEAPNDKYEALQEAYEHYKFMEKLCQGDDSDRDIEKE